MLSIRIEYFSENLKSLDTVDARGLSLDAQMSYTQGIFFSVFKIDCVHQCSRKTAYIHSGAYHDTFGYKPDFLV